MRRRLGLRLRLILRLLLAGRIGGRSLRGSDSGPRNEACGKQKGQKELRRFTHIAYLPDPELSIHPRVVWGCPLF